MGGGLCRLSAGACSASALEAGADAALAILWPARSTAEFDHARPSSLSSSGEWSTQHWTGWAEVAKKQ